VTLNSFHILYCYFKCFQLLNEALIRVNLHHSNMYDGSSLSYLTQGFNKGFFKFLHKVGDDNSDTSRDTCHAMNQNLKYKKLIH
jgi:hypothetical protein